MPHKLAMKVLGVCWLLLAWLGGCWGCGCGWVRVRPAELGILELLGDFLRRGLRPAEVSLPSLPAHPTHRPLLPKDPAHFVHGARQLPPQNAKLATRSLAVARSPKDRLPTALWHLLLGFLPNQACPLRLRCSSPVAEVAL